MQGRRLNPNIHRCEGVELTEVHSEYLECSFLGASAQPVILWCDCDAMRF